LEYDKKKIFRIKSNKIEMKRRWKEREGRTRRRFDCGEVSW